MISRDGLIYFSEPSVIGQGHHVGLYDQVQYIKKYFRGEPRLWGKIRSGWNQWYLKGSRGIKVWLRDIWVGWKCVYWNFPYTEINEIKVGWGEGGVTGAQWERRMVLNGPRVWKYEWSPQVCELGSKVHHSNHSDHRAIDNFAF